MQSFYHNLPVVGGEGELNGLRYRAQDVKYCSSDERAEFSLDLREAYPESAGIQNWKRDFIYKRGKDTVILEDKFCLYTPGTVEFVLMTAKKPEFIQNTMIIPADAVTAVTADFDGALILRTEIFDTASDAQLFNSWGKCVYRTVFRLPGVHKEGKIRFVFRKKIGKRAKTYKE